ncbi:bifunctional tetrahydrofolate synthase/dihydrofolate synthase [Aliidiomarina halalkaliphila]|uniref:Dihydrofolate synthase/folylpolyglutamate synthase n=1 Tax=Aliidiomarina halalkaliphila TaxID=2593535 RepID=A0A552X2S6_9GAMM|nr:bifunctional tetrahydrofolate synthase/dihydrofolate synthase [Aliidiomarina halalkaliphila]TRW49337.1 bifunctional tetrahydrofolate synthase/dihydrofolate synthase [Aliidiomarina halalkaliphila]
MTTSTSTTPVPSNAWSLSQWLEYLEHIHHRPIDMGLERVRIVAERLQLLTPKSTVFVVGGTNGKGSTVAFLEQICLQNGYSTGAYTSPHLIHYSERVRINGRELADEHHARAFMAVEQARADVSLTYFEFGTLAALWLLQQQTLDVLILEVGLGGRLDAVNVIDASVAVVTSVGVDHIEFLGPDRDVIGYEKAGIFRSQRPAICGDLEPPEPLIAHSHKIDAQLYCKGRDFDLVEHAEHFDFIGVKDKWVGLPLPRLPLTNAVTALAALQASELEMDIVAVRRGLINAQLSGRMELIAHEPDILLDVGHNPHASQYLAKVLQQRYPNRRIIAVCGMLQDKDHQGTLEPLLPIIDQWFIGTLLGPRGTPATRLAASISSDASVTCSDSIVAAFTQAKHAASKEDVILCFGSFLTVAAIKELVTDTSEARNE